MKLKAIRLRNVKKFGADGVAIEGIGDRLSILSAPNEFGKSTIFEAVRTMLQQKHNAKNKHTRALLPLSNSGGPEIEIEIEADGQRYRIWKRFINAPKAQVTNLTTGEIVADDGNADDWILALIGANAESYGPMGLLWVEQGASMNQPEGGADLLSALLEAEVGVLVGGDRARTYLQRCQAELNQLLTSGGKPKTGGAYKDALDELAAIDASCAELEERARQAEQSAVELERCERKLKSLTDPEEAVRRADLLAKAEEAFVAARQAAGEVELLTARVQERRRASVDASAQLALFATQTDAAQKARVRLAAIQQDLRAQTALHAELETSLASAQVLARALKDRFSAGRTARQAAEDFESARIAWTQRERIEARLVRAKEIEDRLADLSTELQSNKVTAKAYGQLTELLRDFDRDQARLDASRPVLRAHLTALGKDIVRINAQPLPPDEIRLSGRTQIELGDLGRLEIETHEASSSLEAFQKSELALAAGLEAFGCHSIEDAAAKAAARQALQLDQASLSRELADIAPEGAQQLALLLKQTIAKIPADFKPDAAPPEVPADLDALERAYEAAEADATLKTQELSSVREALAVLKSDERYAVTRVEEALSLTGPEADWSVRRETLKAAAEEAARQLAAAEEELDARQSTSTDLDTARIARDRLLEAKENLSQQVASTREDIGRLLGELRSLEAVGVHEQLIQARATQETCQRRVVKIEENIAALELLATTLAGAQQRLKDAYFKPVEQELQPLLGIVLGKTDIVLSEAFQAEKLRRGDYNESVEALSGGTREQVAVLTRLAFGRMMARQGTPAPVFLDDALVYCDDDRLGAMFNALHAASVDVQCIVLTCHERAFRDIGGVQLTTGSWSA